MKLQARPFLLSLIALTGGLSLAQSGGSQGDVYKRVERLETEVAELKKQAALARAEDPDATEVEVLRVRLDETVLYLQAQAKNTAGMTQVYDESEKLGYTWGINAESRKVLMAAWRQEVASSQKGLPLTSEEQAEASSEAAPRR